MNRFFFFVFLGIFGLSGCSLPETSKQKPAIGVQAEGVMVSEGAVFFSENFALQITPQNYIRLIPSNGIEFDNFLGKKVIIKGIWHGNKLKSTEEEKNTLTVIDITPFSYDWTETYFDVLQGSFLLPIFISVQEENGKITWIKNKKSIAVIEPLGSMPPNELLTPITIGKKEAFRYEQNNSLYIAIPADNISVAVIDKLGDSSLIYSIIETYKKTEKPTEQKKENLQAQGSFVWFADAMRQETQDKKGPLRVFITEKEIFSEQKSANTPFKIPNGFIWLYSDSKAIQIAYPKEMYYTETEKEIRFVSVFGPVFNESDRAFIALDIESQKFSFSSHIHSDTIENMKKSIIVY